VERHCRKNTGGKANVMASGRRRERFHVKKAGRYKRQETCEK
jgi:hypothetical protein